MTRYPKCSVNFYNVYYPVRVIHVPFSCETAIHERCNIIPFIYLSIFSWDVDQSNQGHAIDDQTIDIINGHGEIFESALFTKSYFV